MYVVTSERQYELPLSDEGLLRLENFRKFRKAHIGATALTDQVERVVDDFRTGQITGELVRQTDGRIAQEINEHEIIDYAEMALADSGN